MPSVAVIQKMLDNPAYTEDEKRLIRKLLENPTDAEQKQIFSKLGFNTVKSP